jgi:aspartate-semialdehyde dehydrogenase
MSSAAPRPFRIAVVGASTLLGKELKLVLEDRNFPASDIDLLDSSAMAGTLTAAAGEPTFIRALDESSFEGVRFAFFAGSVADTERNWQTAQKAGATIIDLSGALSASEATPTPGSTAWIPSLAKELPPQRGSGGNGSPQRVVYSSPSPAAIMACTVAAALRKASPERIAMVFFPPVSERDLAGVEELENQTASLLSLREISTPVFGAQVAFNLLTGYGEDSKPALQDVRNSIASEVARYLAGRVRLPAVQLVQTPIFYGYAFAAYVDFVAAPTADDVAAAFAGLGVRIADAGDPAPTNVSVAGESEIYLARVEGDPNVSSAVWLWGAADNLRLSATNAVRIAEGLLATE